MSNGTVLNQSIPMLLYHELFAEGRHQEKYAIPAATFERHVASIAKKGWGTRVLPELLVAPLQDDKRDAVSITFDDGCESDFKKAFPVLMKYACKATFFVTVSRIGTARHVDWRCLGEMANNGMSIQSHSLNHVFLSDLGDESLRRELHDSKAILENRLGRPVEFISLPGGFCSSRVIDAVKKAGYKGVVTSCPGLNWIGRDPSRYPVFKRFVITQDTDERTLNRILKKDHLFIAKHRMLYECKTLAKQTLGSKNYYRLWSTLFKYRR